MSTSTRTEHSSTSRSHARKTTLKTVLGLKWLPFAIGAAISLIAIIVIAVMLFGGSKCDKAVKNYLHMSYLHESGYVDSLAPASVWGWVTSKTDINKDELKDYLAEHAVLYQEELCAKLGNDINISFDIVKKNRISGDEFTAYRAELKKAYQIPDTSVTKAYRLTLKVTLKGSQETVNHDNVELTAVEIDGEYYIDSAFSYAMSMAKNAQAFTIQQNEQ